MHRPVPVCFRRDGVNAMAENESVTPRQTPDGTRKNALRVRRIAIDTFRENVAYLHRDCEIYRVEGFQALAKIQITENDGTGCSECR